MTALAPALQGFFTQRLITQRNASPQTIAAYRDTFRLLLRFAHDQTGKQPFQLDIDDLDAPLIGSFLNHLEQARGNSPRTRNARLGAIHSFYRFAALEHPEHAHTIARVMAIPTKRYESSIVSYLDLNEIKALLAAPDPHTWLGRRDHALLVLMIQTGVRVSELTGLHVCDVHLGTGAHIRVTGKGRKKRATTLTAETVKVIRAWLNERRGQPDGPAIRNPSRTTAQSIHHRCHRGQARRHRSHPMPLPAGQTDHPPHAQTLCERLGYVAGRGVSVDGLAAPADSGHITGGAETAAGALEEGDENRLSVHHDEKGRFLWKQQPSGRLQRG